MLGRIVMRSVYVGLAIGLCATSASAGPVGGNGGGGGGRGGGGALGKVSAGIRTSVGTSAPAGNTRGSLETSYDPGYGYDAVADAEYESQCAGTSGCTVQRHRPPRPLKPRPRSRVDFYAGAQKVHDSNAAVSLELAFVDERFRLSGAVTRFYEDQGLGREMLTLTMPSLTAGIRVDEGGPTRVFLEAGLVGARTRYDPEMSTSITGGLGGVRVEHRIARKTAVIGDAHAMIFSDGIRARAVRLGARVGVLQASFRVLDFNIGPALYGPEVGLRF